MGSDTGASRRHASRPPAALNEMVLGLLRSPLHGLLDPGICELRYHARRTGRVVALPVIYARHGQRYVVVAGDAPRKQWWRNFTDPHPVEVRHGGRLDAGTCRVLTPDDPTYRPALRAYVQRQHVTPQPGDRVLLIELTEQPT